jgi:hypothetical protein
MKKVILKGLAGIFIFVFIVLAGLYVYGLYIPEINGYFAKREEAAVLAKMEAEKEAFLDLHKKDIEGGVTPEETFDLLITALKAGDIDLASKYYVPIYQEEAREVFEEEMKKNGNLESSIASFAGVRLNGKKECLNGESELNGCTFEYIYTIEKDQVVEVDGRPEKLFFPKGSKASQTVNFWLNPYTKKWKIKDQP